MLPAVDIEKIVCRRCFAVLEVGDRFCRHCGVPTSTESGLAAMVGPCMAKPSHGRPNWSESRLVVLAMLFLVLGPLGLPMLWRSRQFSAVWKIVLTVLILGLSMALLAMIWYVLQVSLEPLSRLRNLKGM